MIVARDIAGFTLPFVAGVVLTYMVSSITILDFPFLPTITIFIAGLCVSALLHPAHKNLSNNTLWCIIHTASICCGVLCSLTSGWISICDCHPLDHPENPINLLGEKIRNIISSLSFEDTRTNAVIKALITGDRSGLSTQVKETFRASGASHILALSGMHLGIIYGIIKLSLKPLGNRRPVKLFKSIFILSVCCTYTILSGAGASIIRAMIFISLAEAATLGNRDRNTGQIMLSALIIQLVIRPDEIRDIGFQLSYAAMAGIAWIYPFLNNLWPRRSISEGVVSKGLRWLWSSASVSIACQITTGPLAYHYFGTFPKYFILTNIIATPLVGIIIPFSIAATVLSAIGACPETLLAWLEALVDILYGSLSVIASL